MEEKKEMMLEKNKLDELHGEFFNQIEDLKKKYENLCKQKNELKLETVKMDHECKKLKQEKDKLAEEIKRVDEKTKKELLTEDEPVKIEKKLKAGENTPWPEDIRNNIYLMQNYPTFNMQPSNFKSMEAHDKPIGAMAVHVKKSVIVTGADDGLVKIFDMKNFEVMATGQAHNVAI